jgi:serine/threonine protein kinase
VSKPSAETLLFAALEKPTEAERAAFLNSACGGESELRRQVEKLLKAHAQVGDFLQRPAAEQLAAPEALHATQAFDASADHKGDSRARAEGESAADDDESLAFLQPPTRPDSLGRIGHYEVLQVLGKGGFGIVFRAFDDALQRVAALKVMAPQLAATSPARKRFLREARSSAQVRHENVVQVYEVAEQPLPYLAMEFIPGETLQQRLNRLGPVEPAEVVRVGRQIAEGLAAAHATDLIHRDIKPGNILLEGQQLKVKITDFGLARAADDASISQSGIIAGTPMYMAPEQAKGEKLDQRADLFSLGSVLYQMASGRPPFRANSTVAALKRVAEETPRDIREIIPETPQWLCDIIAKLHAKNPDDRYQSAREIADVLADCEAQLKAHGRLRDLSKIPHCKRQPSGRRHWVAVAAILPVLPLLALAATELAGVTFLFRERPAPAPQVVVEKKTPEPIPELDPKAKPAVPASRDPAASLDPERRAAEIVLSVGGGVRVYGQADTIWDAANLPRDSFQLAHVDGQKPGAEGITDVALASLKDCKKLMSLNLSNCPRVSDKGLAHLKDCKYLTYVNLHDNTLVTDGGIANFKDCKEFVALDLSNVCNIGDEGLAHFKECKDLRVLVVYGTQMSDAGLAHFKDCKKLEVADLARTRISDAGLAILAELKTLKDLHLQGTQVSAKGVENLAKALPECKIEWNGGVIEPRP